MSDIERLRVLGNCLKQSRKKVYRVKIKEARASGLLKTEPGKVFEEVRVRLMEFRESALEKQNRVENEYQNLSKGNLSALQLLPQFESLTSEMDICGVGLSERQLLLGYLRKVGADHRREILKDRRLYPSPTGGPEAMRAAATWREAHRILLEFDAIGAGTKALVAAVGGLPAQTRTGKRKTGKGADADNAPPVNAVDSPLICFRAQDSGTCDRPSCTFSHDEGLLKAARKEKADRDSGYQPKDKGSKGAGKGKGKDKDKGKGKGSEAPKTGAKELCLRFMKGECAKPAA